MRLSAGTSSRLGASWDGRGTNFALFSANAQKVELCLFDSQGRRELERIELPERTEDVWHGYLNDVSPGQLYGYRVHGPYEPEHGHRFNANKLLLDPYARRLAGGLVGGSALSPFGPGARARASRSTGATMRAACRRPSSSTKPSTGAAARHDRTSPGKTPSSTKRTSRD